MARIPLCVVLLVILINVFALPGDRIRRGYDNSEFSGRGGFDRGSDERDASVSQENSGGGGSGCIDFGRGFSNSREVAYNRDGRTSKENRRGGSGHTFSKASASASASAFNQNQPSV